MTKLPADLKGLLPIDRENAMRLADAASRHPCTLTLESRGVVLNIKSMIGLLSQSIPADGQMVLCASGEGEDAAARQMLTLIRGMARR